MCINAACHCDGGCVCEVDTHDGHLFHLLRLFYLRK